jgi:hypothetical protein
VRDRAAGEIVNDDCTGACEHEGESTYELGCKFLPHTIVVRKIFLLKSGNFISCSAEYKLKLRAQSFT